MTKTTILLSGSLAKAFGRRQDRYLDSGTVQEAMRALKATLKGFSEFMLAAEKKGLRFAIFRNRQNVGADEFGMGGTNEIRIVPVIAGSKRGGIFQTVLGAALVTVGVMTEQPWLVAMGASTALGGVMQMAFPQAKGLSSSASPDNKPSYAFGGPVNTVAQGNPVGVLYGKRRIGGAIISAGIYAEDQM
jgi:predicted phage tail protein